MKKAETRFFFIFTSGERTPFFTCHIRLPAGDHDGDRAIARRAPLRRSPVLRTSPRRRLAAARSSRRGRARARAEARGGVRPGGPAGGRGHAAERVVHRRGLPAARDRPRLPPRVAGCWYARLMARFPIFDFELRSTIHFHQACIVW